MNELQRVLVYVVDFGPSRERPLVAPFQIPGLKFEAQVAPALRRLATARPPFLEAFMVPGDPYPSEITGVTERGWEEAETAGSNARRAFAPSQNGGAPVRASRLPQNDVAPMRASGPPQNGVARPPRSYPKSANGWPPT